MKDAKGHGSNPRSEKEAREYETRNDKSDAEFLKSLPEYQAAHQRGVEAVGKQFYHVTDKNGADAILQHGLKPSQGPRTSLVGHPRGTYLFNSQKDAEAGYKNWMSHYLEGEPHLLEVTIPHGVEAYQSGIGEHVVAKPISKDYIRHLGKLGK